MSLTALLKPATSGPVQPGVRRPTDNVAGLDRAAQVRTEASAPQAGRSLGLGVSIQDAERIFDQHLSVTRLNATSEAARWGTISRHLQTASEAMGDVEGPLADAGRLKARLRDMGAQLDTQIYEAVDRTNALLDQTSRLNADISRAKVAEGEASGPEDNQDQAVDELAGVVNLRVARKAGGGVMVRSAEGLRLAGDGGAAQLSYNRADPTKGYIAVEAADGASFAHPIQVSAGEIGGLLELRDVALPGLAARYETLETPEQVAEFAEAIERQAQTADNRRAAALAVADEAAARREAAADGVNVDFELAVMARYQQAANASARMMQAARGLLAVLTREPAA